MYDLIIFVLLQSSKYHEIHLLECNLLFNIKEQTTVIAFSTFTEFVFQLQYFFTKTTMHKIIFFNMNKIHHW